MGKARCPGLLSSLCTVCLNPLENSPCGGGISSKCKAGGGGYAVSCTTSTTTPFLDATIMLEVKGRLHLGDGDEDREGGVAE